MPLLPRPKHLLQSDIWMHFQESLGKPTFYRSGSGWSYYAVLEKSESIVGKLSTRLYVPYGPTAKDTRSLRQVIESLKQLAEEQKVGYVRVDPYPLFDHKVLRSLGLKKNLRNSQPDRTLMLDLRPSEDQLLIDMTSLNRRIWKRHAEFGISFETDSSDKGLKDFTRILDVTAKRTKSVFRSQNYLATLLQVFSKNANIVFALDSGKRVAAALYVDDPETKTRYYMYAGSLPEARKHSCNSAVLAYLIINAKKKGLEFFDFFGVSPIEDTKHEWAGYSAFKRSFGGQDIKLSGTWELPIKKLSHTATRFGRFVAKKLRRK